MTSRRENQCLDVKWIENIPFEVFSSACVSTTSHNNQTKHAAATANKVLTPTELR